MTVVEPVYDRWGVQVFEGDCLNVLKQLPDASIHAVVTDPPYSLRFMQATWDRHDSPAAFQAWCTEWARECLRVLKPGGHLLAFGGTRTVHRLACGIEDAGFEIRDEIDSIGIWRISWIYGGGMPKSRNVSKDVDRMAGAEREVIGANPRAAQQTAKNGTASYGEFGGASEVLTAPATDAARQWEGWGTGLRPAHEPIICARRPLSSTVAGTVLAHGTGALNIDACRVDSTPRSTGTVNSHAMSGVHGTYNLDKRTDRQQRYDANKPDGRWPPNTVLSHAPRLDPVSGEVVGDACADGCVEGCPVRELDASAGQVGANSAGPNPREYARFGDVYGSIGARVPWNHNDGKGPASRFFPCFRFEAKAPTAQRPKVNGKAHETVKPLGLMRWLVRLITPPGGTVLDCFAGTGPTGQAARAEGFPAILIESDPASVPLIVARLDALPRSEARPAGVVDEGPVDLFTLGPD